MRIYIEAIILYIVIFISGQADWLGSAEGFSIRGELGRVFLQTIPSLALIWYLLLRRKKLRDWEIKPIKADILACFISFPYLIATGLLIAFVSAHMGKNPSQITYNSPETLPGWAVLCFSCISMAYLEESFFRFYLLSRRNELYMGAVPAIIFSTALFSIGHIYEGPWGFINAVICGGFLAIIFLRYRTLHGIAFAHGLYNIAVYVINSEPLSRLVYQH